MSHDCAFSAPVRTAAAFSTAELISCVLTMYVGHGNEGMGEDGSVCHALSLWFRAVLVPALRAPGTGALPLMKSYPSSTLLTSHILMFPQHCPRKRWNAFFF